MGLWFWFFIAVAILGIGLTVWASRNPNVGQSIQIAAAVAGILGLVVAMALPLLPPIGGETDESFFSFRIRVLDEDGEPVRNAAVMLDLTDGESERRTTDGSGTANFRLPHVLLDTEGRLTIAAAGFERLIVSDVKIVGGLPEPFQLERESEVTEIAVEPTGIPMETPTLTIAPTVTEEPEPPDTVEPTSTKTATSTPISPTPTETSSPTVLPSPTASTTPISSPSPTTTANITSDEPPTGLVLQSSVQLYTKPAVPQDGGGYFVGSVIGLVKTNQAFDLLSRSENNSWLEIEETDGRVGWVEAAKVLLSDEELLANVPISEDYPETVILEGTGVGSAVSSGGSGSCNLIVQLDFRVDRLLIFWSGEPASAEYLEISVADEITGQTFFFPSQVEMDDSDTRDRGFTLDYNQGGERILQDNNPYILTAAVIEPGGSVSCSREYRFEKEPS